MANYCGECKMNFCRPSSLRAHVKRKHPDKLEELAPITKKTSGSGSSTTNYLCRECDKGFASFGNLRFHVKKKHSDKLEELAPVESKNYKCHQCSCEFNVLKQLIKHRSSHLIIKPIKCSLCPHTNTSTDNLVEHYKDDHSVEILNEILEFDSVEAFQVWKSRTEAETFASFVQTSGAKKTFNHTKTRYLCHRSGNIRARGNNIRKPKIGGSNKIGGYCPARMTVFTNNEKCTVQFCKTHVGHEQEKDMGHLFITKSQRESIAAKLAAKIPLQVVLDEVRDSAENCSLQRIHLLTKKDLYNIEESFNLKGTSVRHAKDAVSVDLVIDINQKHADIDGLVNNLSTTRQVGQQQVEERRKKLLQFVQEELLQANSLDEIEAAERILAPLKPTLAAVRSQQQSTSFVMTSSNYAS